MNEMDKIVEQAEKEGLVYLNDIVDYVKKIGIGIESKTIIKPLVYNALRKRDKNKTSLADMFSEIIE